MIVHIVDTATGDRIISSEVLPPLTQADVGKQLQIDIRTYGDTVQYMYYIDTVDEATESAPCVALVTLQKVYKNDASVSI